MAKPDYDYWDLQQEIERMDAACLCCNIEPEVLTKDHPAYRRTLAMVRRLDEEVPHIKRGGSSDPRIFIFPETTFQRGDLRRWAESTGQRVAMPFLFPEDRQPEEELENNSDSLRADTKEGYLFLIGLLVHALAEKGGPDLRTPRGDPKPAGILRQLERVAQNLKVGMDGLGKSQGNEKLSVALAEIENRRRELPPSP